MDESVFTREMVNSLKMFGWAEHIIPSTYGMRNTPDILACVRGIPIGLEAKMVKEMPAYDSSNILKYTFTKGQEMIAKTMALSGYKVAGIINLRQLKKTLIVPLVTGLQIKKSDVRKYPTLSYVGRGYWDLKELWLYLGLTGSASAEEPHIVPDHRPTNQIRQP